MRHAIFINILSNGICFNLLIRSLIYITDNTRERLLCIMNSLIVMSQSNSHTDTLSSCVHLIQAQRVP